jgi:succinate dehydrogenase/fumarate reductase-like Fe-S protein
MRNDMVYVKVSRSSFIAKEKRIDDFEVPYAKAMTILSMLRYVHENMDPTLAFRDFRCGRGVCNTCRIRVNSKVKRMCETPIQPGQEILLEPAPGRIIKDLVIEFN